MRRCVAPILLCIGLGSAAFACAAVPPPKVESDPKTVAKPPMTKGAAGEAEHMASPNSSTVDDTSAASLETQPEPSAGSRGALVEATLIDLMTAQGTAYLIDYPNTELSEAAKSTCSDKAARVEDAARAALAAKVEKAARAADVEHDAKAAKAVNAAKTTNAANGGKVAKVQQPEKTEEADKAQDPAKTKDAEEATRAQEAAAEAIAAKEAEIAAKAATIRAECLAQARQKLGADVIRFRRDSWGRVQLVISRRNGSAVKEVYVGNVELTQTSARTVEVTIKEGGLGQRPIMKDRSKFQVQLPNSYSLALEDPLLGKLPYVAKVGFVAN